MNRRDALRNGGLLTIGSALSIGEATPQAKDEGEVEPAVEDSRLQATDGIVAAKATLLDRDGQPVSDPTPFRCRIVHPLCEFRGALFVNKPVHIVATRDASVVAIRIEYEGESHVSLFEGRLKCAVEDSVFVVNAQAIWWPPQEETPE